MDEELQQLIHDLKQYNFIVVQGMYYFVNPKYDAMIKSEFDDPESFLALYRKNSDDLTYKLPMYPIIDEFRKAPKQTTFTASRFALGTSISLVFDLLLKKNLVDSSPEIQLLRHLRNALSHGNRFYLKNGWNPNVLLNSTNSK